jgi:cytochrome c oxidase subunit 4
MTTDHDANSSHLIGYAKLAKVWGLLVLLTGLTVWVTSLDIGVAHVWGGLVIASVKGGLVIAFFMHMRFEGRLLKWLLFLTFLILAIFIGFTFFDVSYR